LIKIGLRSLPKLMKKKKKLILFMPFIGGGGVEKNLFIISNYLSNKIDDLYVCSVSKKLKNKFNKKVKFITTKKEINKNFNIRLKYLIALFILFKFLLKNRDSTVVSFQANIYCIILCKLFNIKIIIRSNSSPSGWYHNLFKKIVYKFVISFADCVIVNSRNFKIQMQKKFGIKVKCIYNPLNKNEIIIKSKYKINNNFFEKRACLNILNIGRLTAQKDQLTLLKSAKVLMRKKIKFKILILGSGIEKNNLQNFIDENKLNNLTKIIEFKQNPYPYIKSCSIFVLSSLYEGLPNVLLEAATLKKFIISTNCPTGPKEILDNGKGGSLFEVGNQTDLAKKIIRYQKEKSINIKKINHNYQRLDRFDYNFNLDKYYKVIVKFI
tara:strand:- start:4381 stop:5523 length:1143 start_codon:yes stop_codon:yes gene_type:complete